MRLTEGVDDGKQDHSCTPARDMNSLSLVSKQSPVACKVHADSLLGSARFKLLCATDLWARSDRALQKALWLSEVADAQLLLLHVVDGELPLRIAGRKADLARSALEWRLRDTAAFSQPPVVTVRVGNPQQTIIKVARDWRADMVVLGAASARVFDRIRGTTAERLVSRASIWAPASSPNPAAEHSLSRMTLTDCKC